MDCLSRERAKRRTGAARAGPGGAEGRGRALGGRWWGGCGRAVYRESPDDGGAAGDIAKAPSRGGRRRLEKVQWTF